MKDSLRGRDLGITGASGGLWGQKPLESRCLSYLQSPEAELGAGMSSGSILPLSVSPSALGPQSRRLTVSLDSVTWSVIFGPLGRSPVLGTPCLRKTQAGLTHHLLSPITFPGVWLPAQSTQERIRFYEIHLLKHKLPKSFG